jgi:uncharacterized membrane protein YoaK (UPF0700 family)
MLQKIVSLIVIVLLTTLSGFADAQGFLHAAKIWGDERINWQEIAKSALGFAVGITIYWIVLRTMKQIDIIGPEIQAIIWFAATIIGVAAASGSILKWHRIDQVVAVLVLFGIGWLVLRTQG